MKNILDSLKLGGYSVRVMHFRDKDHNHCFIQKGGMTEVRVTNKDGVMRVGVAQCSKTEQFCRQTGAKIALKRALEQFPNRRNRH